MPEAIGSGGTFLLFLQLNLCTLEIGTFKTQQWDMGRQDFLESAPGLGMFVTVSTYDDEVRCTLKQEMGWASLWREEAALVQQPLSLCSALQLTLGDLISARCGDRAPRLPAP